MNFKSLLAASALVVSTSLSAENVGTTDIRGRVDIDSPSGSYPMAGAIVQLCDQYEDCQDYRTGYDGMYYLSIDPGEHSIFVNDELIGEIFVPDEPYFDIDPLRVPLDD